MTTLGSGVDGTVQRVDTAYDTQGNAYLFTSYATPAGTTIVNQVQDAFNGLGQLTTEYQSHSGAVNTSTTPSVQYAYVEMAGGANNSRLVSVTYPNGRVLTYNYNAGTGYAGLDDRISRLSSLSDSTGTLEAYSYLGQSTVVRRAHAQSGVDLTYIAQTGEANGDAGDKYIGLDRFGRVVDQRWLNATTLVATDRFQYGYERDGNRLYRNNLVNTAFGELYHASGAGNGSDNLNQLTGFARGVLSASQQGGPLDTVASPSATASWSYDGLGNWSSMTTNGATQTRTANQQNEITSISGQTTPGYDNNGNNTTDQVGKTLVYDAWNRLVAYKSGSTTLAAYSSDALGRRIVQTGGGTTTDWYYSNQWQVLEERVGGQAKAQYVWSPVYVDALVERDRDPNNSGILSERLYVQQDANWNVTALVNGSGTVVERYLYDPYGNPTIQNGAWGTISGSAYGWVYLYQGGRYDGTTGLSYFRHRDLSLALGRWEQVDPIRYAAGDTNLYRDVFNSPTRLTDPSGLGDSISITVGRAALSGDLALVITAIAGATGLSIAYLESRIKTLDDARIFARDWDAGKIKVDTPPVPVAPPLPVPQPINLVKILEDEFGVSLAVLAFALNKETCKKKCPPGQCHCFCWLDVDPTKDPRIQYWDCQTPEKCKAFAGPGKKPARKCGCLDL